MAYRPLLLDRRPSSIVYGPSSAPDDRRRTADDPDRSPALVRQETVVHRPWSIVRSGRQTTRIALPVLLDRDPSSIVRGPSSASDDRRQTIASSLP
jgi:hypothetical protein